MKSMTGFGEALVERDGAYVSLKITSVNSRHFDVKFPLSNHPELEKKVVDRLRDRIERGKVEIQFESNVLDEDHENLEVNRDAVEKYIRHASQLSDRYDTVIPDMSVSELMNLPGVMRVHTRATRDDRAEPLLLEAVDAALDRLEEMRRREGEAISSDLSERRVRIRDILEEIEDRVPSMLEDYREKVRERIESLMDLEDEELRERLENELKMYSDKCDISEEIVRVKSHLEQFQRYLKESGAIGKSLEFLLQEIQREINTIGAKANDATISQRAVDIKTELEKCREQVRNVE